MVGRTKHWDTSGTKGGGTFSKCLTLGTHRFEKWFFTNLKSTSHLKLGNPTTKREAEHNKRRFNQR